jgi:putative ABC transport system permease protein
MRRGPLRLALRLGARDLRHRPGTGLLLLLAMLAATTTMTLALTVRGAAQKPWDHALVVTNGPHVVVAVFETDDATDEAMARLMKAP